MVQFKPVFPPLGPPLWRESSPSGSRRGLEIAPSALHSQSRLWGQWTDGSRKRPGRGRLRNGGEPRATCYRFGGRTVQVLGVAHATSEGATIADG
uniref:Uncharacterized protein n=1 Tax=Peronospora matthiolae TaxID=2874970 RepID=A0AAV1TSH5_9STRA